MDATMLDINEIANMNLSLQKLEELFAKNIMERNALLMAFHKHNQRPQVIISREVSKDLMEKFELEIGFRLVGSSEYLYLPADLVKMLGKEDPDFPLDADGNLKNGVRNSKAREEEGND